MASDDDEDEDGSTLGSEEEDDWLVADEERQNESGFGTPRPSSPSGRKGKALRIVDAAIFEPMFDDVALGELAPNARFADYACEILVDGELVLIELLRLYLPTFPTNRRSLECQSVRGSVYRGCQRRSRRRRCRHSRSQERDPEAQGQEATHFPGGQGWGAGQRGLIAFGRDRGKLLRFDASCCLPAQYVRGSTKSLPNLIDELKTKYVVRLSTFRGRIVVYLLTCSLIIQVSRCAQEPDCCQAQGHCRVTQRIGWCLFGS